MPLDGYNKPGQNWAPVEPLQKATANRKGDAGNPSSSNAYFRELWNGLYNQDDDVYRDYIEQARNIALLRAGKLVMKRDLLGGTGYVFFTPSPNADLDRTNYPIFSQNSEALKAKWERIKPVLNPRYAGDGYKITLQMNLVNVAIKSYFKDIFTPDYELTEATDAQDWGTYITHFYYDEKLNQTRQLAPIIQGEPKVMMDGYGGCFDCLHEGTPRDFTLTGTPQPQCPKCGSYRVTDMIPEAIADGQSIVGVDEIIQGDLCGHRLSPAGCRWDLRHFPHQSGYFLYSDRVPVNLVKQIVGQDLEIQGGENDDDGLDLIDELSTRGGIIDGHGDGDLFGHADRFISEATRRNMYLKPEVYTGFKLKEAEETMAGKIPADVPWEEIFPDGLLVSGYNDMSLITEYRPVKCNIASSVYCLESESGKGKGLEDTIDIAKDINEISSMAMAGLKRYGASGVAVAQSAGLTQQDVKNLFRPGMATFVDTAETGDITKSVMQLQPNPVNPVLPQYLIQLNNLLAMCSMNGEFAEGTTNSVDIDTLGGQELATAKEEGKKSGIIALKVWHRMQSAEILSDLMKEHIKVPKWYAGDRQGATRGKWVSGAELPKDKIKFDLVPDTEVPANSFERRRAARQFMTDNGGLIGVMQAAVADPKLTAWGAEAYNTELPTLNVVELQTVCLGRLEDIKELSEIYPDPEMVLAQMKKPLKLREKLLLQKAEFLEGLLDDDELLAWNPVAKASLDLFIEYHYLTEAGVQVTNQLLIAGAEGVVGAARMGIEADAMSPMVEEQRGMQQEDQQTAFAGDMAGRVMDDEQAAIEHERSEDSADRAQGRSVDLEREKAKLAPKPPKPAAGAKKRK